MKKTDKNENENFDCLTLTSSNDSAIESKKIHQKKKINPKTECQNQKKNYFKTFRVKKNYAFIFGSTAELIEDVGVKQSKFPF